ncbi:MAG: ABC transporter ATP-binding protein [Dehalococcoidia bacterium]|nr:ABC transporter ATP-binding protein [Dehalococcoidia bacterium]
MLLELENIIVHYGSVAVINGVSITLEQGELVAIVGANGAGKSTLLRTISGLIKPTSGQILLRGKRVDGISPHDIVSKGIAHVPEGRKIFPYMTVYENLRMGGYILKGRGYFHENLENVYELFPVLKNRVKQAAGTLSGGEQQMLAIARALMNSPKILLMDEPTVGLSPSMVNLLTKGIVQLKQKGISIILVEQNVRVALDVSVRCYVMELGCIVLEGSPEELASDRRVQDAYLGG